MFSKLSENDSSVLSFVHFFNHKTVTKHYMNRVSNHKLYELIGFATIGKMTGHFLYQVIVVTEMLNYI